MNDAKHTLLRRWQRNCRRSQIANYAAANQFSGRNYWLGIPTIILTTVVGTSVFATLQEGKIAFWFQILLGVLSVSAAVLSALQTFFRWGEAAAKFRAAAAEYGTIKREIDQLLTTTADPPDDVLTRIREKMDTISRDAPELPVGTWEKARTTVPTAELDTSKSAS